MSEPTAPSNAGSAIVLRRTGEEVSVTERDSDGAVRHSVLASPALPAFVTEREAGQPLWVWDDTTRWYPALLDAGIRVRRCVDLRLCHQVLRSSPAVDLVQPTADDAAWAELAPVGESDSALFQLHEHAETLDAAAEYERQSRVLTASPDRNRLRLLLSAESSGALVAAEMTYAGLPVRADVHGQILTALIGPRPPAGTRPAVLETLLAHIRNAFDDPDLNPDVPAQLAKALRRAGLDAPDTRSWTLSRLEHPGIPALLEYKKLLRLSAANGWRWLDTWVHDGRYRPTYLPAGVVTGRWASHGGGALSYPGQLRPAVIADEGWEFVVADVAQLEPRALAGMSRDLAMAEAAGSVDLYQGMVDRGAVASRNDGKLAMLGAMYGATKGESGRLVPRLARLYPRAFAYVEEAARAGERGEAVQTFLGRGSPLPDGDWTAPLGDLPDDDGDARQRDRRKWGRFTRNFVVQGTGAEWASCWLATLRNLLWEIGEAGSEEPNLPLTARPHLVFFLHDEVVIHTPHGAGNAVEEAVHAAARRATGLVFGSFPIEFPLKVSRVRSWAEAS